VSRHGSKKVIADIHTALEPPPYPLPSHDGGVVLLNHRTSVLLFYEEVIGYKKD
jgi:hypothetical protein